MAVTKKSVVENLTTLNIYKKEFDTTIEIYVDLIKQYSKISKEFKAKNCKTEEKTAAGDGKKSPTVAALENLRKDILSYSTALGLTPAGLKKINEKSMAQKKQSKLAKALSDLG